MAEILANVDDINANLPSEAPGGSSASGAVVVADDSNTALLQISVARVVRAYLSGVVSSLTLNSWVNPDVTPDPVREAAAKLIASQLYFNKIARSSATIDERHFSQKRYDEAMAILDKIVDGTIVLEDVPVEVVGELSILDGFPIDDTDRAFTVGMEL
jgi:hypothetical protein